MFEMPNDLQLHDTAFQPIRKVMRDRSTLIFESPEPIGDVICGELLNGKKFVILENRSTVVGYHYEHRFLIVTGNAYGWVFFNAASEANA